MRRAMLILAAAAGLAAAGCAPDLTCDEPQPYQRAVEAPKVDAPDGLDDLQEAREMHIPRASPQDPRPENSPCLDLPPTLSGSSADD